MGGARVNLGVHSRVDDALPEYAKQLEKSVSVMEKHSKFENLKYFGPNKLEF